MIDKHNNARQHADRSEGESTQGIDSTPGDLTPLSPPIADPRPGRLDERLLECGGCRSTLMHPADCQEDGPDHWHIELRCPNCGDRKWARCDLEMLDAIDRELDRAEAEIEADLARMTRANMADYLTRFVSALDAGAIEPDDFTA